VDPLLLRKSGSAGIQTRTSGSVARSSGRKNTEVDRCMLFHLGMKQCAIHETGSTHANKPFSHPCAFHSTQGYIIPRLDVLQEHHGSLCSFLYGYQRFGANYSFHHQGKIVLCREAQLYGSRKTVGTGPEANK
jgi:hypothetical protein